MKIDRLSSALNGIRRNWATVLAVILAVLALPLSAADRQHNQAEARQDNPVVASPDADDSVTARQAMSEALPSTEPVPQAYVGTIGADKVVLELTATDTEVTARYFDHNSRRETVLDGTVMGDDLILKSRIRDEVIIELRTTDKGFSGTFRPPGSPSLPVSLSLLTPDTSSVSGLDRLLAGLSLYERQRWLTLALAAGDARVIGTRPLREWHEPASGLSMLWIEGGYPQSALDKINAELARAHWARIEGWQACSGKGPRACYDKSQLVLSFMDNDFLSFYKTVEGRLYGDPRGHVEFQYFASKSGLSFHTQTGEFIELEDLLYLGDGPVPEPDTEEWDKYREEVFPARIARLLQKLHPEAKWQSDACNHFDPEPSWAWGDPIWFLTSRGLYVEKIGAADCEEPAEWRTIPWAHTALRGAAGKPTTRPASDDAILNFGQAGFTRTDIARVSLGFDENGYSVLDIALHPEATKRLEVETIRLLNTDVAFALGSTLLATPRVVEPITAGTLRLSGGLGFGEVQAKAWKIICTMRLTTSQFDPANLAEGLPCKPKKK